jgi:hypothetical protein
MPDVTVTPGHSVTLVAQVEHCLVVFGLPRRGVLVRFTQNEQEVGRALTDACGRASLTLTPPYAPQGTDYVAEALPDGKTLHARGAIYTWDTDKTIVAVDIDETISATRYLSLLFDPEDRVSKPIGTSAEILTRLSKDYYILYTTARPHVVTGKTRAWLRAQGFPRGPLVDGPGIWATVAQASFKLWRFRQLRHEWPNMLVGVGDRAPDLDGFAKNGMLTLLITHNDWLKAPQTVRLPDWLAVERYFNEHKGLLTRPGLLARFLGGDAFPPSATAAFADDFMLSNH